VLRLARGWARSITVRRCRLVFVAVVKQFDKQDLLLAEASWAPGKMVGVGAEGTEEHAEAARLDPTRPRVFSVGGFEVDYFMWVICTDRGQHKRVLLTTARRELGGGHGMNHALRWFAPPMYEQASPHSQTGRESYAFKCPLCRRNPQLQKDRWWSLVDEMWRAGYDELDVSLLP
jgi:hypothetical protein